MVVATAALCVGSSRLSGQAQGRGGASSNPAPPHAPVDRGPAGGWVGTNYPPAPAGVTIERGTTIGEATTARFALADVRTARGHFAWLASQLSRTPRARYRVLDVLALPTVGPGSVTMMATCGIAPAANPPRDAGDVTIDPEILATGPFTGEGVLRAGRAWRADRRTQRFVPIDPRSVVCFDDGDPGDP